MRGICHFSSASGSTVWLVNEMVFLVISQASSHSRPSSSISTRISSGMHRVGWVSLMCMLTCSGISFQTSMP